MQEKESTQQLEKHELIHFSHYKVFKKTLKVYAEAMGNPSLFNANYIPINPQKNDHKGFHHLMNTAVGEMFCIEYLEYCDKEYFFGCSFDVYKKTYKTRFAEYQKIYKDCDEIDFLNSELMEGVLHHKFSMYNIDNVIENKIGYSLIKRCEFIKDRILELGFKLTISKKQLRLDEFSIDLSKENDMRIKKKETKIKDHSNLKLLSWKGSNLQLTELIKALIESNLLNHELSQKEIFKRFTDFLQVTEFDENDKIRDIRKRTHTKTPLLNLLEKSITSYIINKD
jgi:hypothetical protein